MMSNSRKKRNSIEDTSLLSPTSSNQDKAKTTNKNVLFIFACFLLLVVGYVYYTIQNTKIIRNNITTNLLRTNIWYLDTKQDDEMQQIFESKQKPQPPPQETNSDLSDRGSAYGMPTDSYWEKLHGD